MAAQAAVVRRDHFGGLQFSIGQVVERRIPTERAAEGGYPITCILESLAVPLSRAGSMTAAKAAGAGRRSESGGSLAKSGKMPGLRPSAVNRWKRCQFGRYLWFCESVNGRPFPRVIPSQSYCPHPGGSTNLSKRALILVSGVVLLAVSGRLLGFGGRHRGGGGGRGAAAAVTAAPCRSSPRRSSSATSRSTSPPSATSKRTPRFPSARRSPGQLETAPVPRRRLRQEGPAALHDRQAAVRGRAAGRPRPTSCAIRRCSARPKRSSRATARRPSTRTLTARAPGAARRGRHRLEGRRRAGARRRRRDRRHRQGRPRRGRKREGAARRAAGDGGQREGAARLHEHHLADRRTHRQPHGQGRQSRDGQPDRADDDRAGRADLRHVLGAGDASLASIKSDLRQGRRFRSPPRRRTPTAHAVAGRARLSSTTPSTPPPTRSSSKARFEQPRSPAVAGPVRAREPARHDDPERDGRCRARPSRPGRTASSSSSSSRTTPWSSSPITDRPAHRRRRRRREGPAGRPDGRHRRPAAARGGHEDPDRAAAPGARRRRGRQDGHAAGRADGDAQGQGRGRRGE